MSGVTKRSLSIRGHSTSISLEDGFFDELMRIARDRSLSFAALVAEIDERRDRRTNLSSALRLYVLDDLKSRRA
ncbi:aryl-sulfate sulfotransferase [Aliihoeflea aestuarii]|jgi:predicted DNA-binding ribbon-helix-helix protein|uniref:ribbon-helix-helix domain-containing protein n=1 Tax=Aliihoeflea aestuarii TaxID=453840 RepID=UPI002095B1E9|nr:ribbon-helix-helix domain-containing protein [Aliihoeflea aestuarii]MCO6392273.1 aryl-sulfate sulfotransferase [Aliihoeflea aestuarii]